MSRKTWRWFAGWEAGVCVWASLAFLGLFRTVPAGSGGQIIVGLLGAFTMAVAGLLLAVLVDNRR